jgi:hypothetical protein
VSGNTSPTNLSPRQAADDEDSKRSPRVTNDSSVDDVEALIENLPPAEQVSVINMRRQLLKTQLEALHKGGKPTGTAKAKADLLRRDDERLSAMLDFVELFSEAGVVRRLAETEKAAEAERKSLAGLEKLASAFKKDSRGA